MDLYNSTESDNLNVTNSSAARNKDNNVKDNDNNKLCCHTVSMAIGGVIRRSTDNVSRFRQQCYEILQVNNTMDIERVLEKKLLSIIHGEETKEDSKLSQLTSEEELWLDKQSLDWDNTVQGADLSKSELTDGWLNQALAEADEWL